MLWNKETKQEVNGAEPLNDVQQITSTSMDETLDDNHKNTSLHHLSNRLAEHIRQPTHFDPWREGILRMIGKL